MKMKSFLIVSLMLLSSAAFAENGEPITGLAVVPAKDSETVKIVYKAPVQGVITLNIFNQAGTLVYSNRLSGLDGFICPVNFTGMSSGKYVVEVSDASGRKSESIIYESKKGSTRIFREI